MRMFREIRARMAATALLDPISNSDELPSIRICVRLQKSIRPFEELCVERLSRCNLVSDSDKRRMFQEILARMAAMALLDIISNSDGLQYVRICVCLQRSMRPFEELCVERLSTCDLVSDSDKIRMFREIRARMAEVAAVGYNVALGRASVCAHMCAFGKVSATIRGVVRGTTLYVRFCLAF
jgi:hypothetical protein